MKKIFFILVCFIAILAVINQPVIAQIGEIERSFPTNFNHKPTGLTWDGHHLWQIDFTDDMICKLDPATGQEILSFPAPDGSATGLAWDGTHIWCSGNNTDKIYKLDINGTVLNSFDVTDTPRGLEFFGEHLWYVDSVIRQIYKINPVNGAYLDSIPAPAGTCRGLAFNGKYLWCTDRSLDEIYKIDINRKKVIMIIKSPAEYSYGLAWDGSCLWTAGFDSRAIFRLFVTGSNKMAVLDSLKAHIQYKTTIRNVGSTMMSLNTWMCKPYTSIRQRLDSPIIWYPTPHSFTYDQWDQEFAYYNESVAPGDSAIYSMDVNTTNYDVRYYIFPDSVGTLTDVPPDILSKYTIDGDRYDIYNPIIQNAVSEAIGGETNLYWQVRNIHDYIIEHIHYEMDGRWDSAPQVLTQGHGSCSEYTYLFVAMCRAAGIPARYEAGGHLREDMPYIDTVFHRWHHFYLPPYGWIPVDATWDDKEYPANQARYLGGTSRKLFATTIGGGGSNIISWAFNSTNSQTGGSRQRTKEIIWTEVAQFELTISPLLIDFCAVPIGCYTDSVVTLTNMGTANLSINTISITGPNAIEFTILSGGKPCELSPAASKEISIRFAPNSADSKAAYLVITSNALSSPDTVYLKGVSLPTLVDDSKKLLPETFCLEQNYPNPFNPQTTISFGLPKPAYLAISVFNLNGRMVVGLFKGRKQAGYHYIIWDASNNASGAYFIRMQVDNFVQTKKCIILR